MEKFMILTLMMTTRTFVLDKVVVFKGTAKFNCAVATVGVAG